VNSLAEQLRLSGKKMSPLEALHAAIETWIALDRQARDAASRPARGYQWKSLFLPEGTELRMTCCELARYARVKGEHIVFEGRTVSPRGMTIAIAGEGRNAYPTAHEAMAATAAAMTEASRAALLLADNAKRQANAVVERRVQPLRRSSDVPGDCAFD
jgi:hypothetical protein